MEPENKSPIVKNRKLAAKIRRCLAARDLGKQHYATADELLDEVLNQLKPGQRVRLDKNGRLATLIDNFEEKNKVFRAHGIARFELKVSEA